MDVIFHIDEMAKWPMVVGNVQNYLTEAAANSQSGTVELLINGPAVMGATQKSTVDLAPLLEKGVVVAVCANAMRSHDLTKPQLQPGSTVVPAGVFELAAKQHAGFAYIKP